MNTSGFIRFHSAPHVDVTEAAKRQYWAGVLWKRERADRWITALIAEGIACLSALTWADILRMERSKNYKQLGRKGADRLAELAGLGPRPKWEPGHYVVSSDPPA